jgi:hypothetical protein
MTSVYIQLVFKQFTLLTVAFCSCLEYQVNNAAAADFGMLLISGTLQELADVIISVFICLAIYCFTLCSLVIITLKYFTVMIYVQ